MRIPGNPLRLAASAPVAGRNLTRPGHVASDRRGRRGRTGRLRHRDHPVRLRCAVRESFPDERWRHAAHTVVPWRRLRLTRRRLGGSARARRQRRDSLCNRRPHAGTRRGSRHSLVEARAVRPGSVDESPRAAPPARAARDGPVESDCSRGERRRRCLRCEPRRRAGAVWRRCHRGRRPGNRRASLRVRGRRGRAEMVPAPGRAIRLRGGCTARTLYCPLPLPEGMAGHRRRLDDEQARPARRGRQRCRDEGSGQHDADAAGPRPDDEAGAGGIPAQGLCSRHTTADAPHRTARVSAARPGAGTARARTRAPGTTGACQGRVRGIPPSLSRRRGRGSREQEAARADLRGEPGERTGPRRGRERVAVEGLWRRIADLPARHQQLRQRQRFAESHDPGRDPERRRTGGTPQRRTLRLRGTSQWRLWPGHAPGWPGQPGDCLADVRRTARPRARLDRPRRTAVRNPRRPDRHLRWPVRRLPGRCPACA